MSSLKELYAGTGIGQSAGTIEPVLDIVAIHGLNPKGSENHAINTWEDKKSGNLWLRDRIPHAQPSARIFLYEYNSSPVFGSSQGRFIDEANQFLECLRLKRRKDPKRPLLLLGHSLGGILIKQALVNAVSNPRFRDIQEATYGLIFFGTPHGGPGDGWQIMFGKASVRIAQSLPGRTSNDIMEALKQGSLFSHTLQDQWRHQLGHYQVVTFYEGIGEVVPQHSATLGLPGDRETQIKIQAKHGDMCRFGPDVTMDKINYELVEGNMLELCEMASQLVNQEEYECRYTTDAPWHLNSKAKDDSALLRNLEPNGRNPRRYLISQHHPGSFQWTWDTQDSKLNFVNWLRSEAPIFWISGKPGAGKSTLMRYLMESEQTRKLLSRESGAIIVVHYFFHELGKLQEKTFGGLLHAIVYQLLIGLHDKDRAALSQLQNLLKPHQLLTLKSESAFPDDVLMTVLQKLVAECKGILRLLLFIDGIDECHGDHRIQMDFLTDLVRSSSNKKLSVRACIASRVETEIELRLSNEPTFAIHQFTEKDISAYVARKLEQAWELMERQPHGTSVKRNRSLIKKIVQKSEGVFVWVTIVVSQLVVAIEEEAKDDDLYRLLADLPEGLEQLYASIIDKIDQKFWHDTINFLRILQVQSHSNTKSVNTLLKFSAAVQEPMSAISCKAYSEQGFTIDDAGLSHRQCAQVKRRSQRSCRGLVEIEDTEDLHIAKISLLHLTVEEYVIKSQLLERMIEKVDKKLLRSPDIALMAMTLRLLKIGPEYQQSLRKSLGLSQSSRRWGAGFRNALTFMFFEATSTAELSTRSFQTPYIEELDRVHSLSHPDWAKSYYRSRIREENSDWGTDLLSLAVSHNLPFHIEQKIRTNGKGVLEKHGRPLLLYCFDYVGSDDTDDTDTCKVLLNSNADPMETFGLHTVWAFTVTEKSIYLRDPSSRPRVEKLFSLMLEYGADPAQRIYGDYRDPFRCRDPLDGSIRWKQGFIKQEQRLNHLYSTAFHILLYYLNPSNPSLPLPFNPPPISYKSNPSLPLPFNPPTISYKSILKSFVHHCHDLEVTDWQGVGIQDWVDRLDPEMGAFLRHEIAAKPRKRRRNR